MVHNFNNYSYGSPSSGAPNQPIQPAPASNGMADPRTLQPVSHMPSGAQPYPQDAHGYSQSPYDPVHQVVDYRQQHYNQGPELPLPSMASNYGPPTMDTTGQIQPPNMRPKLTTSVFEEEGSVCYQVDVNGICVARREDNHMINGTKLLNVAGMTRGRRDGILKAEKQKNVVKIGPMHLKGVWIPFERALALANQEKITEKLYPLFVHDIAALLYHPINSSRPPALPPAPVYHREELPPLQYGH